MFSRHLVKMTIAVAALALLGSGAQAQVRGRMGSLLGGFIPNTPIGVANSFLNGNFNTGFIPNTPAGVANNYLNGNRNMQGSYINPQGFVPNAPVGVQNSYLYGNPYASFSPQAGTYYPINGSVDFNANTPFIPNTPTG